MKNPREIGEPGRIYAWQCGKCFRQMPPNVHRCHCGNERFSGHAVGVLVKSWHVRCIGCGRQAEGKFGRQSSMAQGLRRALGWKKTAQGWKCKLCCRESEAGGTAS